MRWTDNSGASTAGAARALGVSHSATRAGPFSAQRNFAVPFKRPASLSRVFASAS